MSNTITKALIGAEDIDRKDTGTTLNTFTRADASSRTLTLSSLDGAHIQFRTLAKSIDDLVDGGYDVPIKPSKIFGGATNTNGHTVPDAADDTFTLNAATQTLTNKTLTSPTVSGGTISGATIKVPTLSGTVTNGNTISGGTIDGATISNCTFDGNTYSDETPVVQIVTSADGEVATGTTALPEDDSIPQNTEGDEYLTVSITPKNASNKLIIEATFFLQTASGVDVLVALFQDTTANALAAGQFENGGGVNGSYLRYEMTAGTTSATTFKLRAGTAAGGAPNRITFNGSAAARQMGGVMASRITVTEYKA